MNPLRLCGLALLAGLLAGPVAGQPIWKWRDQDGRVQVSDRPPPTSVPDSAILQRPPGSRPTVVDLDAPKPAPAPAAAASAAPPMEAELEARKRRQQAEQQAQQQAKLQADKAQQQARKAENCTRARNQLAALESGQRMARANEKGERELLDDRGRAEEMQRSRDSVASNCSN